MYSWVRVCVCVCVNVKESEINNSKMIKFNIISVGTPTIETSSKIYLFGGHAIALTCRTEPGNNADATYQWKLNDNIVYVYSYS